MEPAPISVRIYPSISFLLDRELLDHITCKLSAGTFSLHVRVEYLFFIGSQLVALSPTGKIGVWHAMTQHWQIQDVVPIASFDTAGSFLLLGCNNGSIYYIGNHSVFIFLCPVLK